MITTKNHKVKSEREKYIESCKKLFHTAQKKYGKILIDYVRDRHYKPVGCVLAYKEKKTGKLYFGWSKCNVKMDEYNRHVGLVKALKVAVPEPAIYHVEIPNSVVDQMTGMVQRAKKILNRTPEERLLDAILRQPNAKNICNEAAKCCT